MEVEEVATIQYRTPAPRLGGDGKVTTMFARAVLPMANVTWARIVLEGWPAASV